MIKSDIYELMKKKGQRITRQKEVILTIFIQNRHKLLSVNDIIDILPKNEGINSATVYRNVQNFLELEIIESMVDDSGIAKYVIRCNEKHHHHLICLECGKLIPVICDKDKFHELTSKYDFKESYHTLEVYGICHNCTKSKK